MSTPLRAVYRGGSTSYNYNFGGALAANRGGAIIGAKLEDGEFPPEIPPRGASAASFGALVVTYEVTVDKDLFSTLRTVPTLEEEEYYTQDLVKIDALRTSAMAVEAVVGGNVGTNRTIDYLGVVTWTGDVATKSVSLNINVNFGVTFNPYLFQFTTSKSNVNITKGLICFNFATLVCNNPPFTGQTYGQVLPGYEEGVVAEFASGPTTLAPGVGSVTIGDRYQGAYDIVPPLPSRAWFQAYVDAQGATYSANPLYAASRTATVSFVPINSVKVTLTRVSANRFRLYMDQQAVGGVMVLRYSAAVTPNGTRFTLGFSAPTIVYIPADEREAFFDVTPGAYSTYTVTLETCFGLPNLIDAQFWPLAPDPVQFEAFGP
jgi:hypothetical protein